MSKRRNHDAAFRDAKAHPRAPSEAMAMRGDWQLREVTLCLKHRHILVPLWTEKGREARYDFALRLKEVEADLVAGTLERPVCDPTEHDLWLDRRMEYGEDPTWLANHGLYPASAFCRLLGMELLRLRLDRKRCASPVVSA